MGLLIFTRSVVLVHGLRGHPRRSWECSRSSRVEETPSGETNDRKHLRTFLRSRLIPNRISYDRQGLHSLPDDGNPLFKPTNDSATFWPGDLLAPSIPDARILVYGYSADVFGGLFQANNKNSISQHGNDLMVKLERAVSNGVRDVLSIISMRIPLITDLAANHIHCPLSWGKCCQRCSCSCEK